MVEHFFLTKYKKMTECLSAFILAAFPAALNVKVKFSHSDTQLPVTAMIPKQLVTLHLRGRPLAVAGGGSRSNSGGCSSWL